MTLPVNITLTEVTETYLAQNGTDTPDVYTGTVEFELTGSIYLNDPGNAIFPPSVVIGTLDATGTIKASGGDNVKLIPEDDDDLNPTGATYDVTEKLSLHGVALQPRTYSIPVPSSEDPIRLSSIAPTPPSAGSTIYVLSVDDVEPDTDGNVALGAYIKPGGGIPEADLSAAVQTKLDAVGGGAVASVNGHTGTVVLAASDVGAYVLPGTGIPKTDTAMAVQTSLGLADTAVQPARTITAGTGLTGGGSLAADRTVAVAYGTAAGTAAQGNDTRITAAEQTANKNTANGYAGVDSASRVTAAHSTLVPQIVASTFASTLTIDASAGSLFRVTLTGNVTLAAPSNPADGQRILVQFTQDATGSRTLTLDSVFNPGPLTATLSTAANAVDFLLAQYRSAATKWDILAVGKGY